MLAGALYVLSPASGALPATVMPSQGEHRRCKGDIGQEETGERAAFARRQGAAAPATTTSTGATAIVARPAVVVAVVDEGFEQVVRREVRRLKSQGLQCR